MPHIRVNERNVEIKAPMTVREVAAAYKPEADLCIVNSAVTDFHFIVSGGERIVLIKRGEIPTRQELAFMISARSPQVLTDCLNQARIGIAGLGGLGSLVAAAFARMGIFEIVGVDYDVVEPSNINRQYYFLDQIGMKKTEALRVTLQRINPFARYTFIDGKVTAENAPLLFAGCDVIVEAFDEALAKGMLFDAWSRHYAAGTYYVGASGVAGYRSEPPVTVTKIGGRAYVVGDLVTEALDGEGLTASRVGIAAHMQANVAANLLVEKFAG